MVIAIKKFGVLYKVCFETKHITKDRQHYSSYKNVNSSIGHISQTFMNRKQSFKYMHPKQVKLQGK